MEKHRAPSRSRVTVPATPMAIQAQQAALWQELKTRTATPAFERYELQVIPARGQPLYKFDNRPK